MKVNILQNQKVLLRSIKAEEIPMGTVFMGKIMDYKSQIFLKAFSAVVDLEDPAYLWRDNPTIMDYKVVDAELNIWE